VSEYGIIIQYVENVPAAVEVVRNFSDHSYREIETQIEQSLISIILELEPETREDGFIDRDDAQALQTDLYAAVDKLKELHAELRFMHRANEEEEWEEIEGGEHVLQMMVETECDRFTELME